MKHVLFSVAVLAACAAFGEMEPASPESQGVDSQAVLDFIDAAERTFAGSAKGYLHGFVIVRHGKVIAEGSWAPYDTLNEPHMLYSHSKSFTSSAIGFLVDDGKVDLDERIVDLFPEETPANPSEDLKQLRIRDLLTMNVGSKSDHHIPKYPKDWAKEFLAKPINWKPGTGFKYDSDATYMLAAIVEKKSGLKLMDFLKVRMFGKIGIEKAWSTVSPEGVACGGWGMNMTTRELARFGQLYLQRGSWNGEPLLSAHWCALATTRQTWSGWQNVGVKALGEGSDWEQGYGFQFWMCTHGAYRADGASGQLTVVMPEQDMVVSISAGLNDMGRELELIWKHLLPAAKSDRPLPEGAIYKMLKDRLARLAISPVADAGGDLSAYCGKTWKLKDNRRGFASVRFEADGANLVATIGTRAGVQKVPVGRGAWAKGTMKIDDDGYEWLGAYIGEHKTAASAGLRADGALFAKICFTGDTGYLWFTADPSGKLTGEFNAMSGCTFESEEAK
jgi:CubicO group peptidase (beta-lactamase class C family)